MKKIEAIIRPNRVEEVKEALNDIDVYGITIVQAIGFGRQRGFKKEELRGSKGDVNTLSKTKIETVVDDDMVEKVIEAVVKAARMGEIGDGKIFVLPVEDAVRIRTGERGQAAL